MKILPRLKQNIQSRFKYLGGVAALIIYSIYEYLTDPQGKRIIRQILTMQIFFTGNLALRIISIAAFSLGGVTVLFLFEQIKNFGVVEFNTIGTVLSLIIIRVLGPLFTAIIVIARSGTAVAAEIATMNINDEMSALEMEGIDTLKMIIFPRIMGMAISMVLLVIYFNAIGIFGGFLVGVLMGKISPMMFVQYVLSSISLLDILAGILKAVFFGLFVSAISVYHGFQAQNSTQVPIVTTNAVVKGIFSVFILEVLFDVILFIR